MSRKDSYHFFTLLRNSGLTSFVTLETDGLGFTPESFLADGVIEMGSTETHEDVIRYIQVKKMRAVKHSMKKYQIIVESDGLSVLEPVYEK